MEAETSPASTGSRATTTDPTATDPAAPDPTGWRARWYPLAFGEDLGTDSVHAVAVHDEPMALFRDAEGVARAVVDRCPHRAARLSDGRVEGGELECLYHGWRFAGDGRCQHIPQYPAEQGIPRKAHVGAYATFETQGMVWVWPGDPEWADPLAIPTLPALDGDDCTSIDFAIDLPYEQTFLIENVIDIAHIHVAHDGVRGGGHRHLAAPLDFEISERTAEGFEGSYRSLGGGEGSALRGARMSFVAPNLVHYESLYHDEELISGLALYSLPVGRNRCRLLYRAYSNFWPASARRRPRWFEHWTQCTILEQDMDVVVGQAAEMRRLGRPPKEVWLPLKSSDGFVLAYRRWLDEHDAEAPHGVGFAHIATGADPPPQPFDRFRHHTQICAACSKIDGRLQAAKTPLVALVLVLLAVAAVTAPSAFSILAAGLALLTGGIRWAVDRATIQFRGPSVG